MKIAVLSGKGGTGKTLVSVNLAAIAKEASYVDCDVEEPNGHLFFKPENITEEEISIQIPTIQPKLCIGCRTCVDFCKFNALAYIKGQIKIFDEVCHACGGCSLLCPTGALIEKPQAIGHIQHGSSETVCVHTGVLHMGKALGTPIIKKLLEKQREDTKLTVIDCPPGSACIVMDSIKDADYCILVAEPTVYGAHNLKMVEELVRLFHKPYGMIRNKVVDHQDPSLEFAKEKGIKILGEIPFDKELGLLNAKGQIAAKVDEKYKCLFNDLLDTVLREAAYETATDS